MSTLVERWKNAYLPSYGTPTMGVVRAKGCTVWDEAGTAYLDLLAGIAVSSLGHCHPALVEAVTRQMSAVVHTSNLYATNPSVTLAERLISLVRPSDGDARVFLCNSGAEANEAALKVVRKHGRTVDPTGAKTQVVAAQKSFHGRTSGALSLTGQPAKRAPFEPLPPGVVFVPYGDVEALTEAIGPQTAGVFLEPTLGESGVVPAPPGYLRAARALTREHEAYLVVDEIQSGIGRTGAWFAHTEELADDSPDLVTLAKGLGGGLPIGALLAIGEASRVLVPGDHGSTFGGNPIACAAALAVLDTIDSEGLLAHVTEVGDAWAKALLAIDHPLLADVRGSGLWRGIVLAQPVAPAVERLAREAGFLVNAAVPDAVRVAPPLVVTADELATFTGALPGLLDGAVA